MSKIKNCNCNGCKNCILKENNINKAFCQEGVYITNRKGDEQWDLFPSSIMHDENYAFSEVWGVLPPTVLQLLEEGDCPFRE